ncbi:MAG: J domain-containing protein [Lachnospiraceae bacterium]|nr:J domain-containing protein [Lachnospiraceae bacterium]
MHLRRAMEILDIEYGVEFSEIKKKYRRLMTIHHPDAIGSDLPEYRKVAQEIIEAYGMIQTEYEKIRKSKPRKTVWNAKINEQAFSERTIYLPYTLEHDVKDLYQEICRGRYMWNPDEEDFTMLLRSVRLASLELLKQSEEKSNLYLSEQEWEKIRFPYQIKLFYKMMHQYIHPYECLSKLWNPVSVDVQKRETYEFRAFLGEKGRTKTAQTIARLKKNEQIQLSFSGENRIAAWNTRKESLGLFSLEEDALYFLLIPLFKEQLAQIKVVVQRVSAKRGRGFAQTKADLIASVRITEEAKNYISPVKNNEIAKLLCQYEKIMQREGTKHKNEWN